MYVVHFVWCGMFLLNWPHFLRAVIVWPVNYILLYPFMRIVKRLEKAPFLHIPFSFMTNTETLLASLKWGVYVMRWYDNSVLWRFSIASRCVLQGWSIGNGISWFMEIAPGISDIPQCAAISLSWRTWVLYLPCTPLWCRLINAAFRIPLSRHLNAEGR